MIEFLVMAFFVAQSPSGGAPDAGARPALLEPAQQRSPVEITARLVTGNRSQAVFTGDVLVKHRTLELRCDRMTAYYNGPREVTRVACTGNVQAVDGERTARGERAEFDVPTGVLVVTGSPEARQGSSYMTGTRVRLTLGNENIEVENARMVVETAPLKERRRKGGAKQP